MNPPRKYVFIVKSGFAFYTSFLLLGAAQSIALADNSAELKTSAHWIREQGWHGIVPGTSLLSEAEAKLGEKRLLRKEGNFELYTFPKGIEVLVRDKTTPIELIRVTDAVCPDDQFPRSEKAAKDRYWSNGEESAGVSTTFSKSPESRLIKLEFNSIVILNDSQFKYPPGRYH